MYEYMHVCMCVYVCVLYFDVFCICPAYVYVYVYVFAYAYACRLTFTKTTPHKTMIVQPLDISFVWNISLTYQLVLFCYPFLPTYSGKPKAVPNDAPEESEGQFSLVLASLTYESLVAGPLPC